MCAGAKEATDRKWHWIRGAHCWDMVVPEVVLPHGWDKRGQAIYSASMPHCLSMGREPFGVQFSVPWFSATWLRQWHTRARECVRECDWSPSGPHDAKGPLYDWTGLCMVLVKPSFDHTAHRLFVGGYKGNWLQDEQYPPSPRMH